MTIHLVISKPTPSLNAVLKMHMHARRRLGTKYAQEIFAQIFGKKHELQAKGRRRLTIQRYGKRELDTDNFFGGMKILIDAIKKFDLIVDDNSAGIELVGTQHKAGSASPHTRVMLEDLD